MLSFETKHCSVPTHHCVRDCITNFEKTEEFSWKASRLSTEDTIHFFNRILTAVGTRCADHLTPLYPQKLALTSPTGGGRSVGIARSRTKATEFSLVFSICCFVTKANTEASRRLCRITQLKCISFLQIFPYTTSAVC